MKIRRVTSLTALLSFALLIITGIVLYIVPHGRIAYWADWHLWGLTKTEWNNIHINLGILLLLSISLHIYYNWKTIVSYLKNKAKQVKVFTREFNIALVLTIIFTLGTYLFIPPFSWVLEFSDFIKDSAAVEYGEPPYGHAELSSLKSFTSKIGFDLDQSMVRLKKAGIKFESAGQTLREIARTNRLSPQQLYLAMEPGFEPAGSKKMPNIPPAGLGKRSLADICQEYNFNIPTIMRGLANNNIKASSDLSIKKIAEQNSMKPIDVYEIVKKLSLSASLSG
jgi:hypothetical protein